MGGYRGGDRSVLRAHAGAGVSKTEMEEAAVADFSPLGRKGYSEFDGNRCSHGTPAHGCNLNPLTVEGTFFIILLESGERRITVLPELPKLVTRVRLPSLARKSRRLQAPELFIKTEGSRNERARDGRSGRRARMRAASERGGLDGAARMAATGSRLPSLAMKSRRLQAPELFIKAEGSRNEQTIVFSPNE